MLHCVCLSLDPLYNFLCSGSFGLCVCHVFSCVSLFVDPPTPGGVGWLLESLFFVGFLEPSLEMVYPSIGLDGKRCRKIRKDRERWEKAGIDCSLLENTGFPSLQTRTYSLTVVSPANVFVQ